MKKTISKSKKSSKEIVNIGAAMPVIDEGHWIAPGKTIRLEHDNIVIYSFSSNLPVIVNYKNGTIRAPFDHNEEQEVVVSYVYRESN